MDLSQSEVEMLKLHFQFGGRPPRVNVGPVPACPTQSDFDAARAALAASQPIRDRGISWLPAGLWLDQLLWAFCMHHGIGGNPIAHGQNNDFDVDRMLRAHNEHVAARAARARRDAADPVIEWALLPGFDQGEYEDWAQGSISRRLSAARSLGVVDEQARTITIHSPSLFTQLMCENE